MARGGRGGNLAEASKPDQPGFRLGFDLTLLFVGLLFIQDVLIMASVRRKPDGLDRFEFKKELKLAKTPRNRNPKRKRGKNPDSLAYASGYE